MRLALDVSAVPSRPVGAGVYTVNLVRALAALGEAELHLVTRRRVGRHWADVAPDAICHPSVPDSRPARLAWEQARAPRLAARWGIDVWHGPYSTLPLRLAGPGVVTIHDLTYFEHPEWHERSEAVVLRRVIRAAVARAAAVVAVSAAIGEALADGLAPRAPVVTIPHGVDHGRFHPGYPGDADDLHTLAGLGVRPPYVAFLGTMELRKAVPTLVDAFARVAGDRPELRLVLAGPDGGGSEVVRAAVTASGVATRMIRVRWVPDAALPALYRQAAVVASPSLEEGFGLPALEALACGAPLVTTAGSPMEALAGDAALVVPPGNAGALAWALRRVLDDPQMGARLRRLGPEAASTYTWEASAKAHLEAYRLAAGPGAT